MAWPSLKGHSSTLFDIFTCMHSHPHSQLSSRRKSPAPSPLLWSAFCLHSARCSQTSPVDTVPWGWLWSLSSTWPGSTRGAAGVGTSPFLWMLFCCVDGPYILSSPIGGHLCGLHFGVIVKDAYVNIVLIGLLMWMCVCGLPFCWVY